MKNKIKILNVILVVLTMATIMLVPGVVGRENEILSYVIAIPVLSVVAFLLWKEKRKVQNNSNPS